MSAVENQRDSFLPLPPSQPCVGYKETVKIRSGESILRNYLKGKETFLILSAFVL